MVIIILVCMIALLVFLLALIYKKGTRKMKITAKLLRIFDISIEIENEKSSDASPTKRTSKPSRKTRT